MIDYGLLLPVILAFAPLNRLCTALAIAGNRDVMMRCSQPLPMARTYIGTCSCQRFRSFVWGSINSLSACVPHLMVPE